MRILFLALVLAISGCEAAEPAKPKENIKRQRNECLIKLEQCKQENRFCDKEEPIDRQDEEEEYKDDIFNIRCFNSGGTIILDEVTTTEPELLTNDMWLIYLDNPERTVLANVECIVMIDSRYDIY